MSWEVALVTGAASGTAAWSRRGSSWMAGTCSQALKHLLEPEEVANAVAFLLGDGGRSFTGAPLVVERPSARCELDRGNDWRTIGTKPANQNRCLTPRGNLAGSVGVTRLQFGLRSAHGILTRR